MARLRNLDRSQRFLLKSKLTRQLRRKLPTLKSGSDLEKAYRFRRKVERLFAKFDRDLLKENEAARNFNRRHRIRTFQGMRNARQRNLAKLKISHGSLTRVGGHGLISACPRASACVDCCVRQNRVKIERFFNPFFPVNFSTDFSLSISHPRLARF